MALIAFAFGVLLVVLTKYLIADPFRYYGYVRRSGPGWRVLMLWMVGLAALGLLQPRRWSRPSDMAFAFLIATIGIPAVSIPVFWGPLSNNRVSVLIILVIACFAVMRVTLMGGRRPLAGVRLGPNAYWGLILAIASGMFAYLAVKVGFSPKALSFSDVYSQREEFYSQISGIGAYLVGWLSAGTIPLVLALGLHQQRRPIVVGAMLGIVGMYLMTGNKSYLVGMLLTLAAYWLASRRNPAGWGWLVVLGGISTAGAIVDLFLGGYAFSTLLVRRALATAGLNTSFYFDFFNTNPRYGLSHSVLSSFSDHPYDLAPSFLIGYEYYGKTSVAANANLIADGFANFGISGSLGMFAIFGIYLRLIDKSSAHLPMKVAGPALTLVLVAAANTAPLTVLVTHGGLILLMLLLASPYLPVQVPPAVTPDPQPRRSVRRGRPRQSH